MQTLSPLAFASLRNATNHSGFSYDYGFKMAAKQQSLLKEAVSSCTKSSESDIDSWRGGISNGKQEEIDFEMLDYVLKASFTRFVFMFVEVFLPQISIHFFEN